MWYHDCVWQALHTCKGSPDSEGLSDKQTLLWREGDTICLRIKRRKNMPQGSGILRRVCSCRGAVSLCAVHTLWDKFFGVLAAGDEPWSNVTPACARTKLRSTLAQLKVPNAGSYGTHGFRRGHAEVCMADKCNHVHGYVFVRRRT